MRFFKLGLVIGVLTLLSAQAYAGLLVEPYLGFRYGAQTTTVRNSGISNGDWTYALAGYNYGGRLGFTFLGFMGGLDYSMGKVDWKGDESPVPNTTNVAPKTSINTTQLGVFAGYALPFIRIWAEYYLSSTFKTSEVNSSWVKDEEYSGSGGYGFGIGFTGLPIVSINLEARLYAYDEDKAPNYVTTKFPTNTLEKPENKELLISISAPFDI